MTETPKPVVCRIHSPNRDTPVVYRDLDRAFAKIAEAKARGGFTMVAVVGSRAWRQPLHEYPDPLNPGKTLPVPEEELPGRLEHRLIADAMQKLCKRRGIEERRICFVSGGARGVDTLAEHVAWERGCPIVVFPALWEELGPAAGPERNGHIVRVADEVIALPRGEVVGGVKRPAEQSGTYDAIRKARLALVPVTIL